MLRSNFLKIDSMQNLKLPNLGDILWCLFFGAFLTVFLLIMTSCGSKKKTTEETRTSQNTEIATSSAVKTEASSNVQTNVVQSTNEATDEVTTITTSTPIDNTKPSTIETPDGKTLTLNNAVYTTVKTTKKKQAESTTTDLSKSDHKEVSEAKAETKSVVQETSVVKKSDKEKESTSFPWWIWLLIAVAVLFGGYKLKQRFSL